MLVPAKVHPVSSVEGVGSGSPSLTFWGRRRLCHQSFLASRVDFAIGFFVTDSFITDVRECLVNPELAGKLLGDIGVPLQELLGRHGFSAVTSFPLSRLKRNSP